MVDVARVELARDCQRWRHGRGAIARRNRAAPLGPLSQVGKARAQDCRLQFIETAVGAGFLVVVPRRLSAVAQTLDARGQLRIAGDHGATVAQRAEILGRIEAGRAGNADGADRPAIAGGEMSLGRVLDQRQVVPCGDRLERAHVSGLAVQVHRQNRLGPRGDCGLGGPRIEREPRRIDVGEHRASAGHHDRERRIGGRQWRRDHFVAWTDLEGAQDQRDRIGAGADANGVGHLAGGGELRLEGFDFRAQHEPAAGDDPIDRGPHVGGIDAGTQGVKRNQDRHSEPCARGSSPTCARSRHAAARPAPSQSGS